MNMLISLLILEQSHDPFHLARLIEKLRYFDNRKKKLKRKVSQRNHSITFDPNKSPPNHVIFDDYVFFI